MKKDRAENCFFIHNGYKPKKKFCYYNLTTCNGECKNFKHISCSKCDYGKGYKKCQLKNKAFPKKDFCNDFARYHGWCFEER